MASLIILLVFIPVLILLVRKLIRKCFPDKDAIPRTLVDEIADVTHFSHNEVKKIYQIFKILTLDEKVCLDIQGQFYENLKDFENGVKNSNQVRSNQGNEQNLETRPVITNTPKYDPNFRIHSRGLLNLKGLKYNPFVSELFHIFAKPQNYEIDAYPFLSFYDIIDLLNVLHEEGSPENKAATGLQFCKNSLF